MHGKSRTATRWRVAVIATLLTAVGLAASLLGPASAQATSTPWAFYGGSPLEAPNSTFSLDVINNTGSTQAIGFLGSTRTIAANSGTVLTNPCAGGPACPEFADIAASTPDMVVTAQGELDNSDGSSTGFYLSPASFELIGPDGTEYQAIESLSASQSTGLSGLGGGIDTLESDNTGLQALLNPLGGQLGGLSTSLTSLSGQVSGLGGQVGGLSTSLAPLSGQVSGLGGQVSGISTQLTSAVSNSALADKVAALQSEVGTLGSEIATLTKELAPAGKANARAKAKAPRTRKKA